MDTSTTPVAQHSAPSCQAAVEQARAGWIRRLYDLSRRNNLLYFRDLTRGTLELSESDANALDSLLAGESVPLSRLVAGEALASAAAGVQEIRRRAQANMEERGLSTLFLALGMATWTPVDDGRPPAAAVLLLPVAVERKGREGQHVALRRTGEAQVNLVLLHVLEMEFGCTVTSEQLLAEADGDDDILDPPIVNARLTAAAAGVPGFAVTPRAVLGNFAFQKMAMVKDLRERGTEMAAHALIAAVAGDAAARETIRTARHDIDPATLDSQSPDDEFLVFDADSSQQRVIAAVLAGQSGVIQGPPGTGKSQTIANLLATLVAHGKRVLFVAEKRAALEVVLNRLERAGLGRLSLDLHGADVSRQQVMGRLAESLALVRDAAPVECVELHQRFVDRRQRLREHADRMNAPRAPSGLSVFQLLGQLLRLPAEARCVTRWRGAALGALDAGRAATVRDLLTEVGGFGDLFLGADASPWTQAELVDGAAVQLATDLVRQLTATRQPAVRAALDALVTRGWRAPATVEELRALALLLAQTTQTLAVYTDALFTQDLDALATALAPAGTTPLAAGWSWLSNGAYRRAVRQARAWRRDPAVRAASLLTEIRAAADLRRRWHAWAPAAMPQVDDVTRAAQVALEQLLADLDALAPLVPDLPSAYDALASRLGALAADNVTPHRIPRLREMQHTLIRHGVQPLLDELRANRPEPAWWPQHFHYAWLASCLDQARAEDSALGGFNGTTHAQFVEEFCQLDRKRLQVAAARVRRAHGEHAIAVMNQFPEQEALVRREAEKRTRHLPLRALLAQAPDVLTALCPCWMASPLSVSQLLDADRRYFDVVIFDEASQVLPEDAMPALLRASQAVVAGDKHQLPPTTFFTIGDDAEDDETPAATEGFESLLDLLSAFLAPWPLEWHYRSLDEALIAFSNVHIYDSRLVTFPGVGKSVAITHALVPQAEDDGDSSTAEVRRVVELVLEHAQTRPHETLGVIALGIKHAQRIESALDTALLEHPELDAFFDETLIERFFVKNLERVQGDERDAILLSVGYTKDRSGKLPYRFGPLLTAGGERRLNVAVTRARRRMTLISSFTHHDMDPNRSAARGVELLRQYLEYAACNGRNLCDARQAGAPSPDPFSADVLAALTAHDLPLLPEWGASRFRLQFVAQHPRKAGRLVLALEDDGDAYALVPTVRDRDRLRRQQLQALGWTFHRIWAIDWFTRRDDELARVTAAYDAAVACADADDVDDDKPSAAVADTAMPSAPTRIRAACPRFTKHESSADYTLRELVPLVDWVNSDGRLRTDEEIIDEMVDLLGFTRRGPRIEAILHEAINNWQRIRKML